ncbi:MAG: hypothetical protein H6748_16405 [Spirochaetaceae bacterium]|nr:hypothetical protein [Spirochaetaceae bacterium]
MSKETNGSTCRRRDLRRPLPPQLRLLPLLGALAVACAGGTTPHATPEPLLATPGQLEREALALELLATPEVRGAIDRFEASLRAHPVGRTPSGAASARRAAESMATAATYAVVNGDPGRPVVFWGANAPHVWHGLSMPRAGYGIENPDNVYRSLMVDGASRYVIEGRFPPVGPTELHFTVMDSVPSESDEMPAEGAGFVATLRSDALVVDDEGRFEVQIDCDPPAGRPNAMQIPCTGRFPVYVRDLLGDWAREQPVRLEVRRVDGPPLDPAPSRAALATRVVEHLGRLGPFWVAYDDRYLYSRPANALVPPRRRPGGRGLSTSGHFDLAEDEVLVLTLDALGAGSLGVQLTDPWGVASEYVDRTGSLNASQARPDADGRFTFVIAAEDPGVHNWLDPEGLSAGIIAVRWQVLPPDADPDGALGAVRVVKRSRLDEALPPGTVRVTPAEREAQRRARARSFAHRLGH